MYLYRSRILIAYHLSIIFILRSQTQTDRLVTLTKCLVVLFH